MKNKNIFVLVIISAIFLIPLNSHPVESYFTWSHEYWTAKGFSEVSSPIVDKCKDKIQLVMDGQAVTDASVIHYFDKDYMSYISTHTKYSGYEKCMEYAGTDEDLYCYCLAEGLHILQDSYSHNEGGLTAVYLKKYLASNLIGHMTVEQSFLSKQMDIVAKNEPAIYNEVNQYDKDILNSVFVETGGNTKFLDMFETATNIDIKFDVQVFRSGYHGEGFYNTVYKDKVDWIKNAPFWFDSLVIGLAILSIVIIFIGFKFGTTRWKWGIIAEGAIFGILCLLILYSVFISGQTWQITTAVIEVPASLGYLSVSDKDVVVYDKQVQDATNAFLKTGQLLVDDASGRSYVNKDGVPVVGALTKAERGFQYTLLPILVIGLILLNFLLYRKAIRRVR